ncbi:MAG: SAM-dependent methyltransferase [Chitinophagales bacterium]
MKGKLYLIPTILSDEALQVIPAYVHDITRNLKIFFAENERTTRRYLRKTGFTTSFDEIILLPLNEHTSPEEISGYLKYLKEGNDCGLMSEAGVPAVADPGSELVRFCHENNMQVVPLVGPSSIILALMASGLNGQQFNFHGYVPIKQPDRNKFLQKIDQEAQKGITQIFIETPYRNNSLLHDIVHQIKPSTRLCIASDITGAKEKIQTKTINDWKKGDVGIEKIPSVFLLGS